VILLRQVSDMYITVILQSYITVVLQSQTFPQSCFTVYVIMLHNPVITPFIQYITILSKSPIILSSIVRRFNALSSF